MSLHGEASAKPETVLDKPIPIAVTAIPIDFDRDDPRRKQFGKLIFRSGLNLYAKSRHFGGFSGLVIDPSGDSILAVSDAGIWMRADLSYNGKYLNGLSNATLGPVLGVNGKPLRTNAERDSEALALASGDTRNGSAYVGFEVKHRIAIYPFTANSFGPPKGRGAAASPAPSVCTKTRASRRSPRSRPAVSRGRSSPSRSGCPAKAATCRVG